MIAGLRTGQIAGVEISAKIDQGIYVMLVDGTEGALAVLDSDGKIVASGEKVASEVFNVTLKCYDNFWCASGAVKELFGKSA